MHEEKEPNKVLSRDCVIIDMEPEMVKNSFYSELKVLVINLKIILVEDTISLKFNTFINIYHFTIDRNKKHWSQVPYISEDISEQEKLLFVSNILIVEGI
jgi:hypothetical protein